MIEILLAVAAIVVAGAVLLLRDDDELVRMWSQLVSPKGQAFRQVVDEWVDGQARLLKTRREQAAAAARAGTPLEEARLAELERETRHEHRVLVVMRRMLSALNVK